VTLRDPTTALFDPISLSWHIFCTHVSGGTGQGGYPGGIWHWSLKVKDQDELFTSSNKWINEGSVLNASHATGSFDAAGVFTPAAVRECTKTAGTSAGSTTTSCRWVLWFGGVSNESKDHTEKVGVATADSPWGPFKRWAKNPVFSFADANSQWCDETSSPARVDEIKASIVQDEKVLLVKSVCKNGTALPVVYTPISQSSWAPPYAIWTGADPAKKLPPSPLFYASESCQLKGFEEPTLYVSPADGFLHFQGHNHGNCHDAYAHFISRNHSLARGGQNWVQAPLFDRGVATEPVPIPSQGDGVYGGEIYPSVWLDFNTRVSDLRWLNVSYVWAK
jgi:hypothetical protein